jgi:hypothetical protein
VNIRGHALVEVMIGGALLAWAMSGLTAGLVSATQDVGNAGEQQQASMWLQQRVEDLEAQPLPVWMAASAAGADTREVGLGTHPGWVRRTTWNPPFTDQYSFPSPSPGLTTNATFLSVTVAVQYGNGGSLTTTLTRWTGR